MSPHVLRLSGVLGLLAIAAVWTSAAPPRGTENRDSAKESATPARESESEDAAEKQKVEDVSDRVEIRTTGALRSDRYGNVFTGVTIRNTSSEPLEGRLVLVVDSTGIDSLKHSGTDGSLESGEAYIELQKEGNNLNPEARTPSRKLQFTSPSALPAKDRMAFSLVARVLRLDGESSQEDEEDEFREVPYEAKLPGKSYSQADLDRVQSIQNNHTRELLRAHEGVFGTATSEDENGNLVMTVYTNRHGVIKELPGSFDGVSLQQVVNSPFRAGPGNSHVVSIGGKKVALPSSKPGDDSSDDLVPIPEKEEQGPVVQGASANPSAIGNPIPYNPVSRARPVPIGSSIYNQTVVPCAAGTLGCRVVDPEGNLYILSNCHVMAQSNTGATTDLAHIGDAISQPGCLDARGDVAADVLGELTDFQPLQPDLITKYRPTPTGPILEHHQRGNLLVNLIDAAIARISDIGGDPDNPLDPADLVLACTPDDGYGFPSRHPKPARLGMRVHKYGRTTGYTQGTIKAVNINAVINVSGTTIYYYEGQLGIVGDTFFFSNQGDSGSLIVTQKGNHPVGLLFADGANYTIANPIQIVLDRFNVAIDDGTSQRPRAGNNGPGRSPLPGGGGRMGRSGGKVSK